MNLLLGIIIGLKEIWAHKLRSLLTTLGVILGVASLVCMFALVAGLFSETETLLFQVGGLERVDLQDRPLRKKEEAKAGLSPGPTMNDALALRRCPLVADVAPKVNLATTGFATLTYRNKQVRPWILEGVTPAALPVQRHEIGLGRFITDLDLERFHNVCVLGTTVVEELFGSSKADVIGRSVFVNGQSFTIVGQLKYYATASAAQQRKQQEEKNRAKSDKDKAKDDEENAERRRNGEEGGEGENWYEWKNNVVFIPLTTARYKFADANGPLRINGMSLHIADVTRLDDAVQQGKNVLLMTHRGVEDFQLVTQREWSSGIAKWRAGFNLGGSLIASISLIVGGIGIMNIMLASIHERVREFGIRKAIGAKPRDIFLQVLAEGAVLSGFGGMIGIALAVSIMEAVHRFVPASFAPVVQLHSVLIAFGFSVAVGLFAGFFPAIKAARLNPIDALRYE